MSTVSKSLTDEHKHGPRLLCASSHRYGKSEAWSTRSSFLNQYLSLANISTLVLIADGIGLSFIRAITLPLCQFVDALTEIIQPEPNVPKYEKKIIVIY